MILVKLNLLIAYKEHIEGLGDEQSADTVGEIKDKSLGGFRWALSLGLLDKEYRKRVERQVPKLCSRPT